MKRLVATVVAWAVAAVLAMAVFDFEPKTWGDVVAILLIYAFIFYPTQAMLEDML